MNLLRSIGGASFVGRLIALVIVPLVVVGVLADQRMATERAEAEAASDLVHLVDLQRSVAAVIPPAQVERIALSGLARIDELGLSRTLVRLGTGLDFEGEYTTNLAQLESALDTLAENHRDERLTDGSTLGDQLGLIRGALASQRQLSERGTARAEDINAVFEDLDALLADTVTGVGSSDEGSIELGRRRVQLDRLGHVMLSAGEHAQAVLHAVIEPTATTGELAVRAELEHDIQLDLFAETLDDAQRASFAELIDSTRLAVRPDGAIGTDEAIARANDPNALQDSADAILGQLDYLAGLRAYSESFHEQVDAEVRSEAVAADSEVSRTRMLLWASAIVTLLIMVAVMWSIVAPVRRLTNQAARISRGELDQRPITPRGPRDVRVLTTTMNGMLATLHRVNDRIRSLASADDVTDLNDGVEIPGSIGESLRDSVRHLGDVTTQLQKSEALSSAVVAQAADAIWTVDAAGIIRTANEASCALTRVSPDEQIGRTIGTLLSQTTGEATVTVPSGLSPRVLVTTSDIDIDGERITTVIAHDISERSEFEQRLAYQAHHDALTGLPNRFAVLEHLGTLLDEASTELAVLFVDLDGFKNVNDVQGHAIGDRVLAEVASRLRGCVRQDEFVGRLGGDEFVIVVRRFSQVADVVALGHRMIREIEQPYEYDGKVFAISASVGVTLAAPASNALDTIREADNAVYQAKRQGRSRVELFDAEMQEDIDRQADLELALRNAVRSDELVIHLQPVVDLIDGSFSGAEALVRWERPGHGLVPPNDFIPVAERSSVIFDIERWVIMRVCELIESWRRRDPSCTYRVAVNISGRHLIEGDLVADVDAALGLTGADPTMLEFELTETQLLEDIERATSALDQLRRRGIKIAVDDFGTGYSSMTYLRDLPIDAVKIDRSFVARATDHGYDSTVIEALLTIGRTLDLSVVAEGVETDEQLDYIRARGCDRAQGFLLARPMPASDAERIIFAADGVAQLSAAMPAAGDSTDDPVAGVSS